MNLLQFLFYIGIINITFSLLWRWVIILPLATIDTTLHLKSVRFVKILGYYLLVSLTALLTLTAIVGKSSGVSIIFSAIGFIILFMGFAKSRYDAIKEAPKDFDQEEVQHVKKEVSFEMLIAYVALGLYVLTLFMPIMVDNVVILSLFKLISWIYSIPVVGWIIGIGGILYVLTIIFYGTLALGLIFNLIFKKIRTQKSSMKFVDYVQACLDCGVKFNTEEPLDLCPKCQKNFTYQYKHFTEPIRAGWMYSHVCEVCKIMITNNKGENVHCFQCGGPTELHKKVHLHF